LCCALFAATAITSPAQVFTALANFGGSNGSNPFAGLVQGFDGNFYGTTYYGGANNSGTVFKITPAGKLITLYRFCAQSGCADGAHPSASLVQASNGDFYGTTLAGGANNDGTVFKITTMGTLTTLHSFDGGDGLNPSAGLIQATDGNFYGTTQNGGAIGGGTVFKITPSGTLTTLYSFCGENCTDGFTPYAGLVQATDGNLYGTIIYGGGNDGFGYCFDYGCGTVFKITPAGTMSKLYSFCASLTDCSDGALPDAGLVQGTDGNFYGTTSAGGATPARGGTVFKITPTGTRTTLYSFCAQSSCTDGYAPTDLVQATDGNFYGTTYYGGASYYDGTVFKITPTGRLTTLHSFDVSSGSTLVQATGGAFYGTTTYGGTYNAGTVFTLSVGLGPFLETQPASGKAGASVKILGTNLTGATSVTFNGTAATFIVVSPSLITTTVPASATTGEVKVIKPHGSVQSNVPFRVVH
jgi:uncharacterized repeat protein (TIGR03803 family)